jgi:hypothetical protein
MKGVQHALELIPKVEVGGEGWIRLNSKGQVRTLQVKTETPTNMAIVKKNCGRRKEKEEQEKRLKKTGVYQPKNG